MEENELFGEIHEQEENGLFGRIHEAEKFNAQLLSHINLCACGCGRKTKYKFSGLESCKEDYYSKYENINTKDNYDKLLKSGMFWEFHPELSGDWNKDKTIINDTI